MNRAFLAEDPSGGRRIDPGRGAHRFFHRSLHDPGQKGGAFPLRRELRQLRRLWCVPFRSDACKRKEIGNCPDRPSDLTEGLFIAGAGFLLQKEESCGMI